MAKLPKANLIQTEYTLMYDPAMHGLSGVDMHGNKWRAKQDGIRTLGRLVSAYVVKGNVITELAEKYKGTQNELMPDRAQPSLQRWAERTSRSMKRRYGTEETQLRSAFASREQLEASKQRLVDIGGEVVSHYVHLQFLAAQALKDARVGDFEVRITTDYLPGRRYEQDSFHLTGVGEGTGDDTGGAWSPFYNLRYQALDTFNVQRKAGASFDDAVSAINFSQLARSV